MVDRLRKNQDGGASNDGSRTYSSVPLTTSVALGAKINESSSFSSLSLWQNHITDKYICYRLYLSFLFIVTEPLSLISLNMARTRGGTVYIGDRID